MLKSSCLWSDDSDSRVRLVGAEQAPDFKPGDAAIPLLNSKIQVLKIMPKKPRRGGITKDTAVLAHILEHKNCDKTIMRW